MPGSSDVQKMKGKADELVSLALAVCDNRIMHGQDCLSPEQTALTTAALSMRQSIKTFMAVADAHDAAKFHQKENFFEQKNQKF